MTWWENEDRYKFIDTGIYSHQQGPFQDPVDEYFLPATGHVYVEVPWQERLERIREEAWNVLVPALRVDVSPEQLPTGVVMFSVYGPDGWSDYPFEGEILDTRNTSVDARRVLVAIEMLRLVARIVECAKKSDLDSVMCAAIILGEKRNELAVRLDEPHAKRGRKVLAAARAGGQQNASLNDHQKKEASAAVTKLMKEGKSQTSACKQVAQSYGKSGRTIERAWKSNKKV